MKIIEKYSDVEREVYATYRAFFLGKNETYYCIIPEEGYPGLLCVPASKCELTDARIDNFVTLKSTEGTDILMHPIIARESLFDRLVDHDPDAMKAFIELLSKDN